MSFAKWQPFCRFCGGKLFYFGSNFMESCLTGTKNIVIFIDKSIFDNVICKTTAIFQVVQQGPINNMLALVQTGDKPLSEPMLAIEAQGWF